MTNTPAQFLPPITPRLEWMPLDADHGTYGARFGSGWLIRYYTAALTYVPDAQSFPQMIECELVESGSEDCGDPSCDYLSRYLAYGPADLTHAGYHARQVLAEQHQASCETDDVCRICSEHEAALRA